MILVGILVHCLWLFVCLWFFFRRIVYHNCFLPVPFHAIKPEFNSVLTTLFATLLFLKATLEQLECTTVFLRIPIFSINDRILLPRISVQVLHVAGLNPCSGIEPTFEEKKELKNWKWVHFVLPISILKSWFFETNNLWFASRTNWNSPPKCFNAHSGKLFVLSSIRCLVDGIWLFDSFGKIYSILVWEQKWVLLFGKKNC